MELLKQRNIMYVLLLLLPFISFSQESETVIHNLQDKSFELSQYSKKDYKKTGSPIYFVADNNAYTGRVILNLNTLSQSDISVSWQNNTTNKLKTVWTVKLQYRISDTGEWKDIKGKNVVYNSSYKRYNVNFKDIILPEECNNKELVQLSWLITTKGDKKKDPDILFKNINVSSEYDKYLGLSAEVEVSLSNEEQEQNLNTIIFNNIAIPYTFPEKQRIRIKGKNIRDSITLEIRGEDRDYFKLSSYSVSEKQSTKGKTITVSYEPKKEGRHRANLFITTNKISSPISIPIEGSSANNKMYDKNMLPSDYEESSYYSFRIPVFSNNDYQYKFSLEKESTIYIKYNWYRNNTLLFTMYDTLRGYNYCVPLTAPNTADVLEIDLSASKPFTFKDSYFGYPKVKTMIKSGSWHDDFNWENNETPVMEDFVVIDKGVSAEVDDDVACSFLVLSDSANVKVKTGKIFYVSSDIFYNKQSFITVSQYLLPERWNYISSPINQAHAAMFSMKKTSNDSWLMQYNTGKQSKLGDYWSDYITDPKFVLVPGKGYAVYTHDALKVEYEGLLCSSTVTVPLVTTEKDKWNLVGNPYTAPISSKRLYEDIEGKIQGNVIMLFDRENKVYNPVIIDPKEELIIPSLQSFFVEALPEPTEITFKRSHQYIPLTGEPTEINNNYLNLSVSKGYNYQYALLGMDAKAEYVFDEYDCHKMFGNNENMPDIYLKDENDEYSVNVFPDYPAVYDIGLYIGNASEVEINLNNISVLPEDVLVLVEDKEEKRFYNFCEDASIKTFLKSGTTEDYRIHILKAKNIKALSQHSGIYLWKDKNRVLVYSDMKHNLQKVRLADKNNTKEYDYTPYEVLEIDTTNKTNKIDLFINNNWIRGIDIQAK
ncbi:MAG: hypothetical protein IJ180_06590 [Bacteroidales bacterium]|nr:hypothetical protein [Bacteroidales bacterium]